MPAARFAHPPNTLNTDARDGPDCWETMPSIAANLVHRNLRIRPDDNVTVFSYPHTIELAEDIAAECFKVGADVLLNLYTDRYYESYMTVMSEEALRKPSVFCRGLTELSSAEFWLGALYDPAVYRKIPAAKLAANDEGETIAHEPARSRKVRSLFVALGQVTRPRAKAYGFNFPAWERMIRTASAVSPEKLAADGKRVAAALESAGDVHIRANGTDLTLSVQGRRAQVYDGIVDDADIAAGTLDASVPSGQVNIAPLETSGSGAVRFTVPQAWAGRTIRRLEWTFEDGRVASWTGDAVAGRLRQVWEKGAGDKDRIAGLGIGLNPRAEIGFLQNELARGAVTIAIGGNEALGGVNKPGYYHQQPLRDATVEVDGRAIVKDGRIVA